MNLITAKNASFKGLVAKGNGRVSNYAIQGQQKISQMLKEGLEKGGRPEYLSRLKEQGYELLKTDIQEMCKIEWQGTALKIQRLGELYQQQYEKNSIANEKKVSDYQRKVAGMTQNELIAEVEKYTSSNEVIDSRLVDCLSSEIKYEDPVHHEILRTEAIKKNYESPWLSSDEGKQLTQEFELFENCVKHPGQFPATFIDEETGKTSLFVGNIEDLLLEDETDTREEN